MSKHHCFFSPSLHDCESATLISCSVACSSIILQQQKRATLSFLDREINFTASDHQYEEGCIAREEGCSSEAEECEIADGEERSDQEGEEVKIFI
ncbi:hypothetical protein Peur_049574 [Populus x canadensis]